MPLESVNELNYDNILDFIIFPKPSTEFHTFPVLKNALLKFPPFSRSPLPVGTLIGLCVEGEIYDVR